MEDKKNPGQRNPQWKGDDTPGKYFGAVKAWIEGIDNLDSNFEDVFGNLKANQISNRDTNSAQVEIEKPIENEQKERAIDEANDNIDVNGMLHNIMEALKEDEKDAKKAAPKKRVYSPLQRVKRVDPELEKPPTNLPTINIPKKKANKKEDDLNVVDFEKTPVEESKFNPDFRKTDDSNFLKSNGFNNSVQGNINPFAGALFPSTEIGGNQVKEKDLASPSNPANNKNFITANHKAFDSIESTIGDLSAIGVETGVRDNLDSRGSFLQPALFGPNSKGDPRQNNRGLLTPGIQIIDSPDRTQFHDPYADYVNLKNHESPTIHNRTANDSNIQHDTNHDNTYQENKDRVKPDIIQTMSRNHENVQATNLQSNRNQSSTEIKDPRSFAWLHPDDDIGRRKRDAQEDSNLNKQYKSGPSLEAETKKPKVLEMLAEISKDEKFTERTPQFENFRAQETDQDKNKSKDKGKEKTGGFFSKNKKDVSKNSNSTIKTTIDRGNEDEFNDKLAGKNKALGPGQISGTHDGNFLTGAPRGIFLSPDQTEFSRVGGDQKGNYSKSNQGSEGQVPNSQRDNLLASERTKAPGDLKEENKQVQLINEIQEFKQRDEAAPHIPLVDDTQDTGIHNRPPTAFSNIFPNEKDLAKNKLEDKSENPLSKKITGETELRFDEESPFFVNFVKRKFEDESFLLEHDANQENQEKEPVEGIEESEVPAERRHSISEMIELEEFDAPVSNSMIHLFVGMKKRVNKLEYMIQEVRKPEYTLDTFFERNFTFFKGKIKITKNFFFLFLILTGVMLYFIFDTLQANDLSRVKNDEHKQFVANWFIPAAIIFTYYGIAFLYIPVKWLKLLIAVEIIPCLVVIGINLGKTFANNTKFPYEPVYICAYIVLTNLFWAATRALRYDILTNYSWAWSMFYMLSWCILLPTATIAYAIYVSVVSRRFNYNWAHELTLHIGIPTMILLCLTWVYYHFKFFAPASKKKPALEKKASAHQQQAAISKETEDKMREQFAEISEDEEDKKEEEKVPLKVKIYVTIKSIIRKISDGIIIASSLSLGGSLIFIEGLLLVYLSEVTSDVTVPSQGGFYLAIFLYFFIPITVLFGIPIIATNTNHELKMFWVSVISILFPLFVTMPISKALMDKSQDTNTIGVFLILAPTIATIFWLTASYIGLRRKKTKFGSLSFIFICFVIPLVILQPLIDIDAFKAVKVAQGFSAFLLAVGIIILIVALAYLISRALLIKEITQKDRLNTDNYKLINVFKTNLEPFGYWSNSVGFNVNFTISLFTLFHAPKSTSPDLNGLTLGLAFCYIVFFIYNNIALKVKVIESTEISKYGIKSLSAAIIESVRNNELFEEMQKIRDNNERLKGYVRIFSFLIIIISAIIAIALSATSPFVLNLFAALCIGTLVIHIVFEIYCGMKVKYTNVARSVVPLFLTYLWFTHALAFPSVLQLTKVFWSDDERKKKRIEVQLIVLVFIITVSLIAIIANIIFKGIELEQKIKYILAYIRKQLENIAVKSDYFVLQRVFEGWMEHGEMKLKKMLVNRGKPAFWWPVPATNPNTKYSKVLLDFDAYKYMKLRLKKKLENEDGDPGITTKKKDRANDCLSRLLACLGLCLPFLKSKNKPVPMDEELNEEIEELLDLQMHEVPLPPKDEDEPSDDDSDDDYDAGDLGDWRIESQIAENKIEITDTVFKPLDERVLRAMMYYDSGIKFAHNDKFTVDFLKFVFRLFAVGNYKFFKKRWLDYVGYKRFMILSAITPTPEFPDYMIDLTYTLYTHNVGKGQIQRRVDYSNKKLQAKKKAKKNKKEEDREQKMKVKVFPIFEEDFEGFLIHIAKRRFPNEINDRDALYRLIRWHLFPNFLHLLPTVQKEYPHEYDYLKFLIDLYMGMDNAEAEKRKQLLNVEGENINEQHNQNGGDGANKDKTNLDDPNGTAGQNGANKDGTTGKRNSRFGSNDQFGGKKPNCLKRTISQICGAFAKCAAFFLKKLAEFFVNFFFLKTDAQKKADKEFETMQQKADKEEKEEVKKIRADKFAETNLGDDPDLLEEELNKKGQFRRKRRTYPHKPSPDWPIVVETIIKSLKDAENDYEHKKASRKQPYFIPSIRNILTLIARIIEIYSLAALAFRAEVPWGWNATLQDVVSFPSGSSDAYRLKIWSSLTFAIIYCYVGLISINFAKEGVLGADKSTMKAGEFPSRGFAHSQILTYFSTALSVWVIKTFLDVFSCDFSKPIENLFFMREVVCDSTRHIQYIIIAAFGLLLYYPISSFLYPNLQYLNVGNDIKYDTSFVVLFNQAKLIIIAVTVFFPFTDEVLIPLIVSTAIWIGLALVNRLLKPNTVIVLNLWETSSYFICAWMQISAIIVYFTESTALASTLLLLGIFIILLFTYGLHRYHKLPDSYEKVPQAAPIQSSPSIVSRQDTIPRHEHKESEVPLAGERAGIELSPTINVKEAM